MNPRDQKVWEHLERMAFHYAARFNLRLTSFKLLTPKKTFYGDCSHDGHIRMSLRRPKERYSGRIPPSMLIDILAHELAHLREQQHNTRWMQFFCVILTEMLGDRHLDRLQQLCNSKA